MRTRSLVVSGEKWLAQINDLAFEFLDGPVKRVGSTFTPVGFSRILEAAILPDLERIEAAAKDLLNY
jgi:2-oxoisovalerate dehydrogenase E1 component